MVNTPFLLLGVFVSRNISSVGCACCSRLNSLNQEIGLLGSCGFEACATSVAHIYFSCGRRIHLSTSSFQSELFGMFAKPGACSTP